MRNMLLTTCMLVGFGATHARPRPGDGAYPAAVVSRATTLTQALARHIQLHEGQYVAIRRLHLQMLNERTELETRLDLLGTSPAQREAELAAAQLRYETALSTLLRPEQREAYQTLRANFTAHRL